MASGTRLAKERETAKDDSSAMANQISMPALTSLLEEHRQSISAALSAELRSAFASLEAKLDTVQATVTDFGERIESLESNANLTEERIQGRNSSSNTRRLLNIIGSPNPVTPEVVISLDAEKAFDRVEWEYLYCILSKFGFGSDFIAWIRLLYDSPTAHILTNGLRSPPFALCRGTRQGCPLSPLLFALAIEPLAIWLRVEGRVEGITRNDVITSCPLCRRFVIICV